MHSRAFVPLILATYDYLKKKVAIAALSTTYIRQFYYDAQIVKCVYKLSQQSRNTHWPLSFEKKPIAAYSKRRAFTAVFYRAFASIGAMRPRLYTYGL